MKTCSVGSSMASTIIVATQLDHKMHKGLRINIQLLYVASSEMPMTYPGNDSPDEIAQVDYELKDPNISKSLGLMNCFTQLGIQIFNRREQMIPCCTLYSNEWH